MNFETLALDMVEAFYEFAAGDPRLREPLKIDLLNEDKNDDVRDVVYRSLLRLAVAPEEIEEIG